jgi:hypothetical protein
MNTIKIISENHTFYRSIPSSWQELTAKQLLFIAPRLLSPRFNIKDEIVAFLLQIKKKHLRRLNLSQMNGLHQSIDFLYKEIDLMCNPAPVIRRRWRSYRGPQRKLKDMRFGQFIIADTFYIKYMYTRNERDLDLLIASLYVRKKGFDPGGVEDIARHIKKMRYSRKQAILLFFTGCRKYISRRFPELFPEKDKNEKTTSRPRSAWGDVLISLVGESPAEKERIEQLDVYFALSYLQEQIRRSKKLRKNHNYK